MTARNILMSAAGGSVDANYIEDVFSTYLYTGNGSTQTITNGIDLAGSGGMVWTKARTAAYNAFIYDTVRGANNRLVPSSTAANATGSNYLNSFNSNGFTLGSNEYSNFAPQQSVSWTFRKQPKFFDIVTYTGTGSPRTVAHNLGSVPGCIIVKRTSGTETGGIAGWWQVYHRGLSTPQSGAVFLNSTDGRNGTTIWNNTLPTDTVFTVNNNYSNFAGDQYVAYLFAHDAGGFGLTGTDNVISCGSYTGNGSNDGPVVTLGYEPQFLIVKNASSAYNWLMADVMRGWPVDSNWKALFPNSDSAEGPSGYGLRPRSTGFKLTTNDFEVNQSGATYIYIAIRRPMKVPTLGTSVFNPAFGTGVSGSFDTSFPVDMGVYSGASINTGSYWSSRLTGNQYLTSFNTNAEGTFGSTQPWDRMEDWYATADSRFIGWGFRRAPSFFDQICYTGNGTSNSQAHNLTVPPELVIIKRRNDASNWVTLYGFSASTYSYFLPGVNSTSASFTGNAYGSGGFLGSQPTSTQLPITSAASQTNASGGTYVAHLFATCPGVSKVGSYTGNGSTQTINCGFSGGARFVLVKRASTTGLWNVFDTARGMTSGNDSVLALNNDSAAVTSLNLVDPVSVGFNVIEEPSRQVNSSGETYIFLAIA